MFKGDLLASLVVFLLALPLCLGIALSCGVPPGRGLIAGIVGGIVVGSLAGCKLQVSGPAAGLTVVVIDLVREHGLEMLGGIVLVSGLIQLVCGLVGMGRLFALVPSPVVHGMMSGIGLIILASQSHIMLDHRPAGGTVQNLVALPDAVMTTVSMDNPRHMWAAMAGCSTLAVMLLWRWRNLHVRLRVPEALPAIALVTAVACIFSLGITRIDVPPSVTEMLAPASLSRLADSFSLQMLFAAITLCLIASAESMLSTASVDKLHSGERANFNRELTAQGVGNTISGFLGGLPITGVIVRSKANVEAGAATQWSAILHGVWLLLAVALLPVVLEQIPTATLAALLVLTGWRLLDWRQVPALWKANKAHLVVFLTTVTLVVTTSLLIGVAVGLVLYFLQKRLLPA